jgi:uncharacterized protein YndB with AHSA1/START domain
MATGSVVEMQMKDDASEGLKLELVRVIKASKRRVFDAWTRPETIRLWFGPKGKTAADVTADAHVGGDYRISMKPGDCEVPPVEGIDMTRSSAVTGRYTRVDPYDVLAFTWQGDWPGAEESLVTIELRDVEGGTEMTLRHERFLTEQAVKSHTYGWTGSLVKLAELLEGN